MLHPIARVAGGAELWGPTGPTYQQDLLKLEIFSGGSLIGDLMLQTRK